MIALTRRPAGAALIIILLVLLAPLKTWAMGIGYFYATGSGDSITRIEGSPDTRGNIHMSGNGLFLDTNLGKDATFNYRLEFGVGEYGDRDDPYDGFVMIHDFGFSIFRNERSRIWLGPEVMLNSVDDPDAAESPKLFGFGMGLAAGANLNFASNFSLALKAAYISQTLTGHKKVGGVRTDITTEDEFGYASVALVFRFGERF